MNSFCSLDPGVLEVVSSSWDASVDLGLEASGSLAARKVDAHFLIAVGLDEELAALGWDLVPFLLGVSIAFLESDLDASLQVGAQWRHAETCLLVLDLTVVKVLPVVGFILGAFLDRNLIALGAEAVTLLGLDIVESTFLEHLWSSLEWWVWRWLWLSDLDLDSGVWKDLLNWEWSLPENTNGSPEASLVHTNETESLESHGIGVVVQVGVHELVGWHPLGEGACMLPHVEISLGLLTGGLVPGLISSRVHIAAIKESSARCSGSQFLTRSWAFILAGVWQWLRCHELWCFHVEGGGDGLTEFGLFVFEVLGIANLGGTGACQQHCRYFEHLHFFEQTFLVFIY